MSGFGTIGEGYATLSETLNDIGHGVRVCAVDGKGAAVDAYNTASARLADEMTKLADVAQSTAGVCESQDAADSAMAAQDPTPTAVRQAEEKYRHEPTPENRREWEDLKARRAQAIREHEQATDGTHFPDVPGAATEGGAGDEGRGAGGSHAGGGDESPPPTPTKSDPANPAVVPPPPVAGTGGGTTLSGSTVAAPTEPAALSSPTGTGGAAPAPGTAMGGGGNTIPTGGYPLSTPTSAATPMTPVQARKQRRDEEKKEAIADTAEMTATTAAMMMPDAVAHAQGYTVPAVPPTHTTVSGGDARLGQAPPQGLTGHGPSGTPNGSPGPTPPAVMGSGAHLPFRPLRSRPPVSEPPVDMEKVVETERRERKALSDAWK